jgi:hypothetical protein
MVILSLTVWMLGACDTVERASRPDPSTFIAPQVDTAVEPLDNDDEEVVLTGGNNAPVVRQARIDPQRPKRGDPLQVQVDVFDMDGDLLRTRYRWLVNGNILSGATSKKLTPGAYEKGDLVAVEVTVTDGPNDTVFESRAVTIRNSAPTMTRPQGSGQLDGMQVHVKDPDDDEIRFMLSGAPPGLSIDRDGVLHFPGSDDIEETTTFTTRITAEDPEGEQAIWELTLTLNPSTPSSKKYTPGGAGDQSED